MNEEDDWEPQKFCSKTEKTSSFSSSSSSFSSSSSSYGPYTYGGMAPDSSDAIARALDGHVSLDSSSAASPAPSSPSLASTSSSSSSESFLPSDLEEDDNEELEEFLLDAFQGFEATEISAI